MIKSEIRISNVNSISKFKGSNAKLRWGLKIPISVASYPILHNVPCRNNLRGIQVCMPYRLFILSDLRLYAFSKKR